MKAFLVLAFVAACSAQRFNVNTVGRYVQQPSDGRYVHVANPYVHQGVNDGKYVHDPNPYIHQAGDNGQYKHEANPYVHQGGNDGKYVHQVPAQVVQRVQVVPVQVVPQYQPSVRYNNEGGWAILKNIVDIVPEGHYQYEYETENKIHGVEQSRHEPLSDGSADQKRSGFYEYVGDDGKQYRVDWTASAETGFQPTAAHLPTAPPVPEAIARSLARQ